MRTTRLVGALLALVLALTGCSGGDDDPADKGGPAGDSAADAIATDARIVKVSGRLDAAAEEKVLTDVTEVMDRWIDGAYAGDYPRTDFDAAFEDFTKDAKALALTQTAILSNAEDGAELTGVELTQRLVRIDVLAPKGKVAGVTVRFRLALALAGAAERTDLVSGRLMLTPTKAGWKVFGFDVRRGEEGA
ncbi:MAG: hypothetical protein NTX33_09290 [Propionibacteriales bacterium]|nr:hypothetical protein [Propionibacteriales bacterium]